MNFSNEAALNESLFISFCMFEGLTSVLINTHLNPIPQNQHLFLKAKICFTIMSPFWMR